MREHYAPSEMRNELHTNMTYLKKSLLLLCTGLADYSCLAIYKHSPTKAHFHNCSITVSMEHDTTRKHITF